MSECLSVCARIRECVTVRVRVYMCAFLSQRVRRVFSEQGCGSGLREEPSFGHTRLGGPGGGVRKAGRKTEMQCSDTVGILIRPSNPRLSHGWQGVPAGKTRLLATGREEQRVPDLGWCPPKPEAGAVKERSRLTGKRRGGSGPAGLPTAVHLLSGGRCRKMCQV